MNRSDQRPLVILDSPRLLPFHATGAPYAPSVVGDWDEMAEALVQAHPSTVALVDPYLARTLDDGPSPRLRDLIAGRPSIAVVAGVALTRDRVDNVSRMLDWGVAEMIDLDLEVGGEALRQRLFQAHARPLKRRVEEVMSRWVSPQGVLLVRAACEVAVDGGGAPDLARRFGVEPRTVAGWCSREALPPPRRLQAWMRVLLACTLLEEAGRSVLNAARGAGYANDHALRRAMRELAGGDPATLPRGDAFARAAERFNDELLANREKLRERRRATRRAGESTV